MSLVFKIGHSQAEIVHCAERKLWKKRKKLNSSKRMRKMMKKRRKKRRTKKPFRMRIVLEWCQVVFHQPILIQLEYHHLLPHRSLAYQLCLNSLNLKQRHLYQSHNQHQHQCQAWQMHRKKNINKDQILWICLHWTIQLIHHYSNHLLFHLYLGLHNKYYHQYLRKKMEEEFKWLVHLQF
jgi:hypothetical protein